MQDKSQQLSAHSLSHLHLNLSSSEFGGLKFLHQHVVTQEITLCSKQPGQQLILQKLQLNLEHILLSGQFTLQIY